MLALELIEAVTVVFCPADRVELGCERVTQGASIEAVQEMGAVCELVSV